jgi:hypothetical protein
MRTTVTLDDDVYELAMLYAKGRGVSLGTAISELARKGEAKPRSETLPPELTRTPDGFLVFAAREGRRVITSEMVKALQEDEIE